MNSAKMSPVTLSPLTILTNPPPGLHPPPPPGPEGLPRGRPARAGIRQWPGQCRRQHESAADPKLTALSGSPVRGLQRQLPDPGCCLVELSLLSPPECANP